MKDINTIIGHYKDTAIDVFNFITTIPSPLAEFVFKRIVDEAYAIANVISFDCAKKQLIHAIGVNFNTEMDTDQICQFLGVNKYYKEIEGVVMEKDMLIEKLNNVCLWQNLPSSDGLIHAYSCYSVSNLGDDWIRNTETTIWSRLMNIIEEQGSDFFLYDSTVMELKNCFQRLGYQTLFINWCYNQLPSNYDCLFIDWYCKGKLVDVVLTTIFECGNNIISNSLMTLLLNECRHHRYLAEVTQSRYEDLRKIKPQLGVLYFEYEGEKKTNNKLISCMSLGFIPKSKNDRAPIGENLLYKLYEQLEYERYLDCGFEAFKVIFSGYHKHVKPIVWKKDVRELANFLCVLRAKDSERDKEYSKQAEHVFLQNNGKPCKWKSLNQPDTQHKSYKELKKIFSLVGIER